MQGKRDNGLINWELEKSASQISAGKIKLDSVLLLADQNPKGRWASRRFRERVRTALASGIRMIAILPLAQHTPERMTEMETSLKVSGFNGVPLLDMPGDFGSARANGFSDNSGMGKAAAHNSHR